ncbi:hypothetical protein ACFL2H_07605, partial [Planctomycetota bacterium]
EGPHADAEVTRICSMKMTAGSALGKLAAGLNGGPIATGQSFDFSQYVNATGVVVAEATQGGGSRVASFQRAQLGSPVVQQQHETF